MGQNRKVRKSRHQNELELFEEFPGPLEKHEKSGCEVPDYDFQAEVEKDASNETRLFWAELIVLAGIVVFIVLRGYLLSLMQ